MDKTKIIEKIDGNYNDNSSTSTTGTTVINRVEKAYYGIKGCGTATTSMLNVEQLPTEGDLKILYKLPDGSVWSYYSYEENGVINKGYSRLDDPNITPPEDVPVMQAYFDTEGNLNIECESAYFDSEGNLVIEDSVSYFDEEGNLVIEDGGSKTINYVIEPTRKTKGSLLSYDGEKYIASNGLPYLTTAPTSNNNSNGLILVVLDSEPAKKYEGYIYIIGGEQ